MPPRFVLDENLRGTLWWAIQDHNARGAEPIDAVRVGDPDDLPLGIKDPELLRWADRADRILVTADYRTMRAHFKDHLAAGQRSPGLFLIRKGSRYDDIVAFLAFASHAGDEAQWRDQVTYIP